MPGGKVHELPADLRKALVANTKALDAWKDITPLARNEFICWVEDAKQETDATTSHSPDARGTGGRPAAALLLARLQAPRAHRQIASGASAGYRTSPSGPGQRPRRCKGDARFGDAGSGPTGAAWVSQSSPGEVLDQVANPTITCDDPVAAAWHALTTLSESQTDPRSPVNGVPDRRASAMAQRCSRVHQMTLSSLTVLRASQPRARLASSVLKP